MRLNFFRISGIILLIVGVVVLVLSLMHPSYSVPPPHGFSDFFTYKIWAPTVRFFGGTGPVKNTELAHSTKTAVTAGVVLIVVGLIAILFSRIRKRTR